MVECSLDFILAINVNEEKFIADIWCYLLEI